MQLVPPAKHEPQSNSSRVARSNDESRACAASLKSGSKSAPRGLAGASYNDEKVSLPQKWRRTHKHDRTDTESSTANERKPVKRSFRQSEIARRCSHRDPGRCDARCEIARRTAPCAWPSATTNRVVHQKERRDHDRPCRKVKPIGDPTCRSDAQIAIAIGMGDFASPTMAKPESRAQKPIRAGEGHRNGGVVTGIAIEARAGPETSKSAKGCRCNPSRESQA